MSAISADNYIKCNACVNITTYKRRQITCYPHRRRLKKKRVREREKERKKETVQLIFRRIAIWTSANKNFTTKRIPSVRITIRYLTYKIPRNHLSYRGGGRQRKCIFSYNSIKIILYFPLHIYRMSQCNVPKASVFRFWQWNCFTVVLVTNGSVGKDFTKSRHFLPVSSRDQLKKKFCMKELVKLFWLQIRLSDWVYASESFFSNS
jgi:hypothetical protein